MTVGDVLIQTIIVFAQILRFLFIARIILSLFSRMRPGFGHGGVLSILYALTEPILAPLRGLLQRSPVSRINTVVDFSPIFAFILIDVVSSFLISIIGLLPF